MKNKSSAWEMIKLGLVLACFSGAACTVLAAVNNVTSTRIAQNKIAKANQAMKEVFANADEFVEAEYEKYKNPSIEIKSVYLAKSQNTVVGGVAQVSGPTYDKATIMVGIKTDGTVTGVRFLENTDSPGFGLKASDPTFKFASGLTFYNQFEGKNSKGGFKSGENFDIISGATITSNGAAALINAGCETLLASFEGAKNE